MPSRPLSTTTSAHGRTVVCNVSRAIAAGRAPIRGRPRRLVTAPLDVLQARLAARERDSDGDVAERLDRAAALDDLAPDIVIENLGDPKIGAGHLAAVLGVK